MFLYQDGSEFMFGGRKLDLSLAVSKEEVAKLQTTRRGGDVLAASELCGRNLHLARIGCKFMVNDN